MTVVVVVAAATALAAEERPELVSRASGGSGAKANGRSSRPSISADGRYVAFESHATNLVPEDTGQLFDVYVRDLDAEVTSLVSRVSGPSGAKADGRSEDPVISGDGRVVAFASTASNLVVGTTRTLHVYARDLVTGITVAVDRAPEQAGPLANNDSGHPAISADGRYVAFDTAATNLDPADSDDRVDVYVRDLATGSTRLVSGDTGAQGPLAAASLASISADGSRVAFRTVPSVEPVTAAGGAAGGLLVNDLATATTTMVRESGVVGAPSISADGTRVAFATTNRGLGATTGGGNDVFVRDLETGRTLLASRDLGFWGRRRPGKAIDPSLSADGRVVGFSVQHGRVGRGYRLGTVVRDLGRERSTNVPSAISQTSSSKNLRNFSLLLPGISADADRLVFQTEARGRVPGDRDRLLDVFVVDLD